MVGHEDLAFNIQLVEVDAVPFEGPTRPNAHIGFISEDPVSQIRRIEDWAVQRNLRFSKGGWSDRELYFDIPELFVDAVIEIMHVSILDE